MENVGESKERNKKYSEKFSREQLIKNIVQADHPIIFDIGAHRGESVLYLKRIFPSSSIYSFEPDPDSFKVLERNDIDGVCCLNLAISDTDGVERFYRNKISHTNSLFRVNLQSKDSIGVNTANAKNDTEYFIGFNQEIDIPTLRLDSFVKANAISHIDLLKIDVQGAECKVLNGAREILGNTKVIVLEISFFDYYNHQTTFMDVEMIISSLGFRLFSISEISNNPMNGRTDWAEVIYMKI